MADTAKTDLETVQTPGVLLGLPRDREDALNAIVDDIDQKKADYARSQAYYDGHHGIRLTMRARRYLQASGLPYAHNFMQRIVDAMVDRLEIESITARVTLEGVDDPIEPVASAAPVAGVDPDEAEDALEDDLNEEASEAVNEYLSGLLERCSFPEVANIVHHEAGVKGDAYPHVFYDHEEGEGRLTYAFAEDCAPTYCPDNKLELEYVAKAWHTTLLEDGSPASVTRLNLYYDDRVEKYVRLPSGWEKWQDEGDPIAWPMPWVRAVLVDDQGEPLTTPEPRGIQIQHLRNRNRGRRYGTSELRTAIPQQDAINKRMIDLDTVSDNQGFQQRWATGVNGSSTLKNHPGAVWRTTDKDAKFGYFPAGDLGQILEAIHAGIEHLSATTSTPLHEILTSGTPPSGEALKTAETPIVKKVGDRQLTYSGRWKAAIMQLLRIAIDHDLVDTEHDLTTATIELDIAWKSAETRNDKEHLETQNLKKTIGVSNHTLLLEEGYDPDVEEARRQGEATNVGAALLSNFNAGNIDGSAPA